MVAFRFLEQGHPCPFPAGRDACVPLKLTGLLFLIPYKIKSFQIILAQLDIAGFRRNGA
jgi:hypothetical protein